MMSKSALVVIYLIGVASALDHVVDIATQRNLEVGGCYATYQEGVSYPIGGIVSVTITDTSSISAPTYTMGDDGQWIIVNDDSEPTTTTYNYECNSIRCGDALYGPGETGESLAWKKLGECDVTLPTITDQPLPPIWSETGCPLPFDPQENDYEGGEIREVDGIVYKCAASPQNMFCGMDGMYCLCYSYLSI